MLYHVSCAPPPRRIPWVVFNISVDMHTECSAQAAVALGPLGVLPFAGRVALMRSSLCAVSRLEPARREDLRLFVRDALVGFEWPQSAFPFEYEQRVWSACLAVFEDVRSRFSVPFYDGDACCRARVEAFDGSQSVCRAAALCCASDYCFRVLDAPLPIRRGSCACAGKCHEVAELLLTEFPRPLRWTSALLDGAVGSRVEEPPSAVLSLFEQRGYDRIGVGVCLLTLVLLCRVLDLPECRAGFARRLCWDEFVAALRGEQPGHDA